jgi:diguanylate cyclase (GGDEF)-like protein
MVPVAGLLSVAAAVGAVVGGWALLRRDRARHRLARLDPLTGLGNRTELAEATERTLAELDLEAADGDGSRGPALLLIDLDGFKEVNDVLGHAAGDAVLVQVARQLESAMGPHAAVTRLGGDEFAVLLRRKATAAQAVAEAKLVLVAFGGGNITARGISLDVQASIGVALAPQHGRQLADLLRHADVAMYEAKRTQQGVIVYHGEIDPGGADRLGTLALIRGAMDQGQLNLRYQPVVDARTGDLLGLEALLRWEHPVRGLLLPAEFIPLVERTALIHPVTRWVLLTATKQASAWVAEGLDITVAVNISAASLEPQLLGIVDEALALSRLPADRLVLEITESAITTNPVQATAVVQRLRDRGLQVSVDDFGAGFTSLSLLGGLPVHQLKIDRQFTEGLGTPRHDAIVSSIIELGHRLDLVVVAEGVETAECARQLVDLGCDVLQGYYFARPLVATDVQPWAAAHRVRPCGATVAPVIPPPASPASSEGRSPTRAR